MTINKLGWLREHLGEIPVVVAIFLIAVSVALDMLGIKNFIFADAILLSLLAAISIYIIILGYKTEDSFKTINESLSQNADENLRLNTRIDKIDESNKFLKDILVAQGDAVNHWGEQIKEIKDELGSQVTAVQSHLGNQVKTVRNELGIQVNEVKVEIKDLKTESAAKIRELGHQNDFYRQLNEKVKEAQEKVWLMHLDPHAPTSDFYNDPTRKEYFENCLEKAKSQQVVIKRIINIPTMDKLEWTENLIKETSGLQNIHLAYINIDDIEHSFPQSVISCQIIDNDSMFLLNPMRNVVPEGDFPKCILIENKNVVSIYTEYYDALWKKLSDPQCTFGCIIKNGPSSQLFETHHQRIKDDINSRATKQNTSGLLQTTYHAK